MTFMENNAGIQFDENGQQKQFPFPLNAEGVPIKPGEDFFKNLKDQMGAPEIKSGMKKTYELVKNMEHVQMFGEATFNAREPATTTAAGESFNPEAPPIPK